MERIDDQTLKNVRSAQMANAGLMKEGFKCDTLFQLMNNCADRCQLMYVETGIQDESQPGVTCYKNCVTKAYKLATQSLQ